MEKVSISRKTLVYGGLAAALPTAYVGSELHDLAHIAHGEKPPEISAGVFRGRTREYRHRVGRNRLLDDDQIKAEKDRYKKYFSQLSQAPTQTPGELVVTASAQGFTEKRAALQEGQTKEAFFGAVKRLFSEGARTAHRLKQVQQAATQAAERVQTLAAAASAHGVDVKSLAGMMAPPAAPAKSLISRMFTPGGLIIGGSLLGAGAVTAPALERSGFKVRELFYPDVKGLPERVRMDELAAESFANSVGKELGKSTVGLVGDVLSKGISLPGDWLQTEKRESVFDSLRQTDDIIAKADPQQLNEAYRTMVRFAPTLATDTNAVKTFLRESVLYGTGPNFMAIKQLADAEKAVNPTALVKVSR